MRAIASLLVSLPLLITANSAAAEDPAARTTADTPVAEEAPLPVAGCLQSTGSRIKRKKGDCSTAPGRVHRNEDLRASGATSAGDALRNVDPSVGGAPGR